MLTKDEATRIAGAVNQARPDWSPQSLMAVLGDERCRRRAYRDLFLAFIALALDDDSRKPTRILVDGPWWQVGAPRAGDVSASAWIRPPAPDDCDVCGLGPDRPHADHEYTPRHSSGYGQPIPDPLRESISEQMAATKLALTAAPCVECGETPTRHTAPAFADHEYQPEATQEEA